MTWYYHTRIDYEIAAYITYLESNERCVRPRTEVLIVLIADPARSAEEDQVGSLNELMTARLLA
jgi:hypothetical protein